MKTTSKKKPKLNFYLQKGDIVDIVAPASACSDEHLQLAVKWLTNQGLVPRHNPKILKPEMYLSNSDEFRFKDLKNALYAKDSKAVWCLRGGYGSFRLWPELLKLKKIPPPKLFIGLSDITSMHQFLNQNWKWPALHASHLDRVGQLKLTLENVTELKSILFGEASEIHFKNLIALNKKAQAKSKITGIVRGGNLATFVVSLGTKLQPKYKKNEKVILFFEDIGERGYRVDRFLQQLIQTEVLKNVQAIVFGDFTDAHEANGKNLIEQTLIHFAEKLKIPVLSGLAVGHGDIQRPLFFNTKASLTCGVKPDMVVYSV